ncbi:MAG: flavodoxin family protein [Candidatus Methanomethylophilaceae archaeon]|jgi:multimeric flavodoxin WrbA
MNILLVNGSPRKDGNTSALVNQFVKETSDRELNVKTEFLFDKNIKGCSNCGYCVKHKGECAVKDYMQPLLEEIKNADLIIIASPIYMWQFTACVKAFLERIHCLSGFTEGKKLAVLTTMGDDEFVASYAVSGIADLCEYYGMKYTASFAVPYADKERVTGELYSVMLKEFAERILQS